MKIAYLHYLYGKQAGLHHVRQFADAARGLGAEIDVHAMHPFAAQDSSPPRSHRGDGGARNVLKQNVLKRRLSRYLHEPKELLMSWSYAAREVRLLRERRPDVLLVRNSHLNQSCIPVARRLGLPLMIEINAPPEEARLYFDQYWHIPVLPEWIEGWKLRRADGIVVVSSWAKNHLAENYRVEAKKITVTPNGADLRIFHPGLEADPDLPGSFRTAPVVGFVGSFLKWHGSPLLGRMAAEVAAARPDVCFLFVGDGPGLEDVRQRTAELGDRVVFTGRVDHARVPGLVAAMDVGVLPESHPYGSPLKVIEWMGAGRAIVAPDYVPLRDVIDDGKEGVLFPPRDGEAIVRRVLRLLDDVELRQSLGRAAAERARTSLTWEHNARRVLGACEKALKR